MATNVTVLDGALGYPADPGATLQGMRDRFDAFIVSTGAAFDAEMAAAKAQANPGDGATTTDTDRFASVALWPTFRQADRRIVATFIHTVSRAWERIVHVSATPPDCPLGAPCLQQPPAYDAIARTVYGVEQGVIYEADASGTIVSETLLAPERTPVREEQERLGG